MSRFFSRKKTTLTIKNLSYSQNISDTLKGFQVKVQVQVWGFPYFENLIIQDEGVAMLCHSIIANALRISFYRTSKKPITRFALFYLLVWLVISFTGINISIHFQNDNSLNHTWRANTSDNFSNKVKICIFVVVVSKFQMMEASSIDNITNDIHFVKKSPWDLSLLANQ